MSSNAADAVAQTPTEDIRDQTYLQTKLLRSISNSINNIELFLIKSASSLDESQQNTRSLVSKLDTSIQSIICLFQEYRDTNAVKERKYFVVVKGDNPGIYDNFDLARSQLEGKADAYIRAFDSFKDAKSFNDHLEKCSGCQTFAPPTPTSETQEETKTSL
jgi:hypothetical protein